MNFAHPQMLWLLLLTVPLLVWFLWWAWRRKQALIAQFVQSRLLAQLTVGVAPTRQKIRLTLLVVAVAGALLALARPQWGFEWEEVKQRGLDIVVAIDTSRSMLAEDVRPNRLSRAKLAALDLMKLAKNDRLALVPFAGAAFLQCPLTLDEQAFRQCVEALEVGIIPRGGTALTEAIETALTAYKEGDNYKILVLFTDGEDHESGAVQAAEDAARAGLRIFTVGVGTPSGELLRVTDDSGAASYVKDDQGSVVKSRLDEALLQQVATATGGFYLPLRGAYAMDTLYEKGLAPLPKSESSSRLIRRYHERFQWPLALAILALLAEMLLPERKRVPRTEAVGAANADMRKALAALAAVAGLTFLSARASAATEPQRQDEPYRQALKDQRQLEKRLKEIRRQIATYEERLKRNPNDPRLHYNRGTVAYEAQDYETAEKELPLGLSTSDLKLQQRAYYNLGNTLYRSGQKELDVNQKMKKWEASVRNYQGAVALDPHDANAQFNLEFVKEKLDELKKQQAKQDQKQDQDKDPKQNQQPDQKQSSDSSKPQQKQERQQSKPDSKPQDQQQQAQNKQENADTRKQKEPEQQNQQQKEKQDEKGDPNGAEQAQANAEPPPGQMSVQQAQQLLDSQKGETRAMIFLPAQMLKEQKRAFKDW